MAGEAMRFSLSFSMDGAAFDGGDNSVDEVCRILHTVAADVDDVARNNFEDAGRPIRDISGHIVGEWTVVDDSRRGCGRCSMRCMRLRMHWRQRMGLMRWVWSMSGRLRVSAKSSVLTMCTCSPCSLMTT